VLVSLPENATSSGLKKRLSNMGADTKAEDFLSGGEPIERKETIAIVPEVRVGDLEFSQAVARIMAGYKGPPLNNNAGADPEINTVPVAETNISSLATNVSSLATMIETSTTTDPVGESTNDVDQETKSPSFWSYKASRLSFGALVPSPSFESSVGEQLLIGAQGPTLTSEPVAPNILSSWLLSDGAPNFATSSNLKRKREMDEANVLLHGLVTKHDIETNHINNPLDNIARLLQEEKVKTEILNKLVDSGFIYI